jgi:hypothetical protein
VGRQTVCLGLVSSAAQVSRAGAAVTHKAVQQSYLVLPGQSFSFVTSHSADMALMIPEIQDALRELESELSPHAFFPSSGLKLFGKERLCKILRALPDTKRTHGYLAQDIIYSKCVLVFLILLRMGRPEMISCFTREDTLTDSHLPFSQHTELPRGISFEDFNHHQHLFCPPRIKRGNTNYRDDRILPFTSKVFLANGGGAVVDKVTIHPDFDGLHDDAQQGVSDTRP